MSYYSRLALAWPSGRSTLPPADPEILAAALSSRSSADREQIEKSVQAIESAANGRGEEIESTTRNLLPAILAWSIAVDNGEIVASGDPGEPLLELFEAGFQLGYRHEGFHIHYESGWRIYQPPARSSLS